MAIFTWLLFIVLPFIVVALIGFAITVGIIIALKRFGVMKKSH